MTEESPIKRYIATLDEYCNLSIGFVLEHKERSSLDGLACYYLGRCISCFMAIKTLVHSLDLAGSENNFAQDYINSLPSGFPRRDIKVAQTYIKETHMVSRFALFQNFYSQTEFTYRIIQREIYPHEANSNPFRLMAEKYGIMGMEFVKFINAIRNTIHNNGYYFPSDGNPRLEHEFNGKKFTFVYGHAIHEVNMQDIFDIIKYVLIQTNNLFQNPDLSKIAFKSPTID